MLDASLGTHLSLLLLTNCSSFLSEAAKEKGQLNKLERSFGPAGKLVQVRKVEGFGRIPTALMHCDGGLLSAKATVAGRRRPGRAIEPVTQCDCAAVCDSTVFYGGVRPRLDTTSCANIPLRKSNSSPTARACLICATLRRHVTARISCQEEVIKMCSVWRIRVSGADQSIPMSHRGVLSRL